MECTGRGYIDPGTGLCVCDKGWASFGDVRAQGGDQCDVSTVFVRVVYGLPILLFPLAVWHSTWELVALIKSKGWKRTCKPSNRVFVIHSGTILSSIVLTVAFISKIIFPERAIGIDATITWLFFIGMTFFFMVIASAFSLFVTISIKQEKFGGSKSLVQLLMFSHYLMPFLCMTMWTAFGLVVAASYVRPNSIEIAERLIIGFWGVLGLAALFLLISTPLVLHSACRDLDAMVQRHPSDSKVDDLRRLSKKLSGIRRQSIARGVINSTMFFVTAFVPQVRYWGPYFLGLQAMVFSVVVLTLSTLTSTRSNGSSGSSKDSKSTGFPGKIASKETNAANSSKEELTTKDDVAAPDLSPSHSHTSFPNKKGQTNLIAPLL